MPKAKLEPGETLLVKRFASHTQGWLARGGRLFVTSDRLLFRPHLFDRLLGGRSLVIPRANVRSVDIAPPGKGVIDGSLRRRLLITLDDGSRQLFVVNGLEAFVKELRVLLGL